MRAANLRVEPSASRSSVLRASLEVEFQRGRPREQTWWFEVPAELGPWVNRQGDPWLPVLLPLAFVLGEPLEIRLPTDSVLRQSCHRVLERWHHWYPQFRPIPISTELPSAGPIATGELTASFFSSGVDSLYTAVHDHTVGSGQIDELLYVQGFDSPINNPDELSAVVDRVQASARVVRKRLVVLATNIRDTRFQEANWDQLAHGPLLAAAALLLAPRYAHVFITSSWVIGPERAYGSHPEVDPLFSTSGTHIRHYRPHTLRTEKIAFLSEYPEVLQQLRVCWARTDGSNCGQCLKCLRTMVALELYDALEQCRAFPSTSLNHRKLRNRYFGRQARKFIELRDHAIELDRMDIASSLNAGLARNDKLSRVLRLDLLQRVFARAELSPALRRISHRMRPLLGRVLHRGDRLLP